MFSDLRVSDIGIRKFIELAIIKIVRSPWHSNKIKNNRQRDGVSADVGLKRETKVAYHRASARDIEAVIM